jgi:hypothetical protein
MALTERHVNLGDVRLSIAEAGAGPRRLLLVHGFTGAKEDFTPPGGMGLRRRRVVEGAGEPRFDSRCAGLIPRQKVPGLHDRRLSMSGVDIKAGL